MKPKKILAILLVTALIFTMLPALSMTAGAVPFTEITIVSDAVSAIRAVDFDSGDYDWVDKGGSGHDIREDEEVATEFGSGVADEFGGNIGWTDHGTRIQWTVNVAADGDYRFAAWLASDNGSNEGLSLLYNDTEIGSIDYVEQEGWQEYALYTFGDAKMTAGTQVIQAQWGTVGGFNITAIIVTPLIDGAPIWTPVEHKVSGSKSVIRAVDFDSGAANYGKDDNSDSKVIRPDEMVNTEVGESEFGGNIGWIKAGEWVQYSVKFERDGMYKFDAWLATDSDTPGGIKVYIGDTEVGETDTPNKNGWQEYELYNAGETAVTADDYVIKVEFLGGNNFSALEITRTGNIETPTEAPPAEENAGGENSDGEGDANEDSAATEDAAGTSDDKDSGGNMVIIIIIAAVAVVAILVIAVIATKRKKPGEVENKDE